MHFSLRKKSPQFVNAGGGVHVETSAKKTTAGRPIPNNSEKHNFKWHSESILVLLRETLMQEPWNFLLWVAEVLYKLMVS